VCEEFIYNECVVLKCASVLRLISRCYCVRILRGGIRAVYLVLFHICSDNQLLIGYFFIKFRPVFLNRRAAARYRALASIIPGRERFSWNLSF